MAILEIKKFPDDILKKKCRAVTKITDEITKLLDDMVMTMHAAKGIGLAASQVGVDLCILVADTGSGPIKLINPKFISCKGSSTFEEGCLSLPDVNIKVKRAATVVVSALNIHGIEQKIEAEGFLAHVLQHEMDHLQGKLLIDYLPFYKRPSVKRRLKQLKRLPH